MNSTPTNPSNQSREIPVDQSATPKYPTAEQEGGKTVIPLALRIDDGKKGSTGGDKIDGMSTGQLLP